MIRDPIALPIRDRLWDDHLHMAARCSGRDRSRICGGEMTRSRSTLRAAAILAAVFALPHAAAQESYPVRPVRLILPYPPGGSTDFVARELTAKLSESFGQQFIIDSRPGAGTVIGLSIAA